MLSMRVTAAVLALGLVVSACGGDDDEEPVADSTTTTTEPTSTTVDDQPIVSEPTTLPPPVVETTTTLTISTTTESVLPDPDETSVAPPQPPSNVKCVGGTAEGELLVEFDALSNPESVSKIRVYVEVEGEVPTLNGEFTLDQIDTSRDGGTRWAAPARSVRANVNLRVTATSFNQLGQESGWYLVPAFYAGPGMPCDPSTTPTLPPPTCTAGCDEDGEGEPTP